VVSLLHSVSHFAFPINVFLFVAFFNVDCFLHVCTHLIGLSNEFVNSGLLFLVTASIGIFNAKRKE
jgi:hypothetical protein